MMCQNDMARALKAEAECDRLRAKNVTLAGALEIAQADIYKDEILDILRKEVYRLRAEKAAIEAATIERCAQLCDSFEEPHMARLIRKLAKTANETEGK